MGFGKKLCHFSKIIPPLNKGLVARISSIGKQLEKCKSKEKIVFKHIENDLWIEANVKYAQSNIKVKVSELDTLNELAKGKDIQEFNIVLLKDLGVSFASNKKFIESIEKMIVEYYEGVVEHITSWKAPTPKINKEIDIGL